MVPNTLPGPPDLAQAIRAYDQAERSIKNAEFLVRSKTSPAALGPDADGALAAAQRDMELARLAVAWPTGQVVRHAGRILVFARGELSVYSGVFDLNSWPAWPAAIAPAV